MPKKSVTTIVLMALSTLLLLASAYFTKPSVQALENNDGSDEIVEYFDEAIPLTFTGETQTYPDKAITFKLVISPKVDIAKATVSWIYNKDLFSVEGKSQDILDLSANQERVLYKTFYPNTSYRFKVSDKLDFGVKLSAASYDRMYLSARKLKISLNSDFETVPSLPGYEQQKSTVNIITILLVITLGGLAVWLIVVGVRRFQQYLNSED